MSLKAFHIFFLFVATLFFISVEYWAVKRYLLQGEPLSMTLAAATFVGCALLIAYATWFVRKLKNLGGQ